MQIDVSRFDTSRWAQSKWLLFGSFLCLSKDNFETMLFATVADRDPKELGKGRIHIQFVDEQDVEKHQHQYLMVESPAYFEAYRHVLKGLKELNEDSLPFKKYLVECRAVVDPPNISGVVKTKSLSIMILARSLTLLTPETRLKCLSFSWTLGLLLMHFT